MMMMIIERTSKRNHSKPFNIKPSFDWLQLLNNMQQKKALVHLERPLYFLFYITSFYVMVGLVQESQ